MALRNRITPFTRFLPVTSAPISIPALNPPTEPNSAFRYADLQYIRNTYAGKVGIKGDVWRE